MFGKGTGVSIQVWSPERRVAWPAAGIASGRVAREYSNWQQQELSLNEPVRPLEVRTPFASGEAAEAGPPNAGEQTRRPAGVRGWHTEQRKGLMRSSVWLLVPVG